MRRLPSASGGGGAGGGGDGGGDGGGGDGGGGVGGGAKYTQTAMVSGTSLQ